MTLLIAKRRRIIAGILDEFRTNKLYWVTLLLTGVIFFLFGGYFAIVFFYLTGE